MTTTTETPVREISLGTTVIAAGYEGPYRWDGPSDDLRWSQIAISFGKELSGLRCDPHDVAPASIVVPAKDNRVAAAKMTRGLHPTGKPWLVHVDTDSLGFFETRRDGVAAGVRTAAIHDWHNGIEVKAASPDEHQPLINHNTSGTGIRTFFSCSCGWKPKTMPQAGSTMHVGIMRHLRGEGIHLDNLAGARYAAGYPAAGMTWKEWKDANPGRDPITGLTHDERFGQTTT